MANSAYEILIVGGNMAGVAVAHSLLKNTIPVLRKQNPAKTFHVTILSPSSHYFWKISAPRILVKADEDAYNQILRPIVEGFKQYGDSFTFIQGAATGVDPSARTVTLKRSSGEEKSIHYDSLVIATGTRSATPLWTLHEDHTQTLDALKTARAELSKAKTVLVAGGGAVGVESSGEIATTFPDAKVTLVSGASRLLARSTEHFSKSAETAIAKLGVEVINNVKVENTEKTANGQTKVTLKDGSERIVDVYINGTGGSPNSSWLPTEWLNEKKVVKVDNEFLRVEGTNAERVYAIGDVASYSNQRWLDVDPAVAPVASSVGVDIAKALKDDKKSSHGWLSYVPGFGSSLAQKKLSPINGIFLIPMGVSHGVGLLFNVEIPAFMLSMIKGKTYFLGQSLKEWTGSSR